MTHKNSAIRHLKSNAKKGDISAAFQLYKNYSKGLGVEKNADYAQQYLKDCESFFNTEDNTDTPKNSFMLQKIKMIDFRKFKEIELTFEKNLTVLIGNNGAGKTTIVESIVKILSWISNDIVMEQNNASLITYGDINNTCEHYAAINAEFLFGNTNYFSADLSRAIKGAQEKRGSNIRELRQLANIWRSTNAEYEINLPLFAFYSVDRFKNKNIKASTEEKMHSRFDAYEDALKGTGRFDHFVEWFIALHKRTQGDLSNKLEQLEKEVSVLRKIASDEKDPLWSVLQKTESEYSEALKQNELNNTKLNDHKHKQIIHKALVAAIPEINDINVETSSGYDEIMITLNQGKVKLTQLSAGQRVYIALIADLARRLVFLNPKLTNPLAGQGIILIDEIDLHLHPKWQQQIVPYLQKIFPNIQFIITTHSPQVLSTVDKKCIRQLIDDGDGDTYVKTPELQTKGVMSSDVLERIMETYSVPPIPEAENLSKMLGFIQEDRYTEPEAIALYDKLTKHFGEDHPEIQRCNGQIRFQKMKEKVRNKMNEKNK